MKEIISHSLGKSGFAGGIRFDLADDRFDTQASVSLLPRILVVQFEMIVSVCTCHLSEASKDLVVGMLAEVAAERMELFVTQVFVFVVFVLWCFVV